MVGGSNRRKEVAITQVNPSIPAGDGLAVKGSDGAKIWLAVDLEDNQELAKRID